MKQVNIVEETEWSKSKVSMLLSEMEDDGDISKPASAARTSSASRVTNLGRRRLAVRRRGVRTPHREPLKANRYTSV